MSLRKKNRYVKCFCDIADFIVMSALALGMVLFMLFYFTLIALLVASPWIIILLVTKLLFF